MAWKARRPARPTASTARGGRRPPRRGGRGLATWRSFRNRATSAPPPGRARATPPSSGTVSGNVAFFQNQGNFCTTTRSCTGATYLQSQYQTNMPIGETKVFIQRASDNATIGQGVTDGNGRFTISWTDPSSTG